MLSNTTSSEFRIKQSERLLAISTMYVGINIGMFLMTGQVSRLVIAGATR